MLNGQILVALKVDLQISTDAQDDYLESLIELARRNIEREGITIQDNVPDGTMIEMYAAHIYRTRRKAEPMPPMLRWMLNNRLFSEKGATNTDG